MEKQYPEISISEFKATCLKVIDNIGKSGESIVVTKRGEPVALIAPPPQPEKQKSWLGKYRKEGKIIGDIISPAADLNDWEVLS